MADVFLRRTLTGMVPADLPSEKVWRAYKLSEVYKAKITKPRNYRHHCLFMVLLEQTFKNQERYTDEKMFRRAVALEAGHVEQIVSVHGEPHLVPLSYSYDELPDEDEFTKEFAKAMGVCAKSFLHGMDVEHLRSEVLKYAAEHYGITS